MNIEKARIALKFLQDALAEDGGAALSAPAEATTDKKVLDPNWFQETCMVLAKTPGGGAEGEKLQSLQEGLKKYGSLTAKQWRMFMVIHKNLLGSFPDPTPKARPAQAPLPEDLDSLAF